jgi:hypothetical protein
MRRACSARISNRVSETGENAESRQSDQQIDDAEGELRPAENPDVFAHASSVRETSAKVGVVGALASR